jgi:tetratricopeptide (TPR) repeat protein
MSERYRVTAIEDVESIGIPGQATWRPLRAELGIEAFGVNAWTAEDAGQVVIGEHDEAGQGATGHQELYIVVSGSATFTVDGDEVDAPSGTLVVVPDPSSKRSATATEAGTTVLVVGAPRGSAYEVAPWEGNARALRFWGSEDWEGAIAELAELHRETPDSGGILYNLACAEARAGRNDDALEHLSAAVAIFPGFAGNAQADDDLASIRDDPRFPPAPADG